MNYQQQAHFKTLPEAEKLSFLRTLKPGLSDTAYQDWINWVESPIQHVEKQEKGTGNLAETLARIDVLRQTAKAAPPPEPPDYFARDVLLNQYLMGGSTRFDDASLANPNLIDTEVIHWFKSIQSKVALIIGGPGAGKTWGTLAWMNSLATARGGNKVEYADAAFITAFRLSEMFHNQKKFQIQLDEILQKRHLLIDDLGAEPSGFRGADFVAYFDYLFSERHRFRRSTFITSNATRETIKSVYGDRFISRFNEVGNFLETTQKDMRAAN